MTTTGSLERALARAGAMVSTLRTAPVADIIVERQMTLPHVAPAAIDKTMWGSPAGKKRLAARLVKLIPPHKVYVEPFAGSAAVFFEKEPAEVEVLGDADPEIACAFQSLKTLSDRELEALRKKDWIGRRATFTSLQEAKPRGKVEKLYRFLYLSHFAYGKLRGKSYDPNAEGVESRTIERIEQHRDRLRKVTIRRAHYADLVKEFDGKDTFFYLDPPYPGHDVEVGEDAFDETELRKVLDGIKGRFLVTYGTRGQLETKGFHVKKILPPRTIGAMRGVGGPKVLPTLLIANYAITEKSLDGGDGAWPLVEVEEVLHLHGSVGDDLDRARLLARALAEAPGAPAEVGALSRELDRLEPSDDQHLPGVARELGELVARLAPALTKVSPSIAEALDRAEVPLQELAKAQWSRTYVNDLPDDAFLYVEPGGDKDDQGKTVPRSLRHFPVRSHTGELDVPHLRNALARIPQSDAPGLSAERKRDLAERARRLLEEASAVKKALCAMLPEGSAAAIALAKRIPLLKTDEERYVLGVVLEPETVDSQRDIYSAAEVREAAHTFMADYRNLGLMHRELLGDQVKLLESYLAPTDFQIGDAKVRKGTWLLALRVVDDALWAQVKEGELGGLSIGGSARRYPEGRIMPSEGA